MGSSYTGSMNQSEAVDQCTFRSFGPTTYNEVELHTSEKRQNLIKTMQIGFVNDDHRNHIEACLVQAAETNQGFTSKCELHGTFKNFFQQRAASHVSSVTIEK